MPAIPWQDLTAGLAHDAAGRPAVRDRLARAAEISRDVLLPRADATDADNVLALPQLRALAEAGVFALPACERDGGCGGTLADRMALRAVLAAGCGVTTFLALQPLFLVEVLNRVATSEVRAKFLPPIFRGEWLAGICLGHVAKRGLAPAVAATLDTEGVTFTGTAPWFTGWGAFDHVLLGGTLPGGGVVIVMADAGPHPALTIGEPLRLEVFGGTQTVSVKLDGLRVPIERLVAVLDSPKPIDPNGELHFTVSGCSMGVAGAAVRRLREMGNRRGDDVLLRAADTFSESLAAHWQRLLDIAAREPDGETFLFVRAEANLLALRATYALIAATGGQADLVGNAASRLYRECMGYTFNAHNADLRDVLIQGLARPSR